jgi:hypothetical protein
MKTIRACSHCIKQSSLTQTSMDNQGTSEPEEKDTLMHKALKKLAIFLIHPGKALKK